MPYPLGHGWSWVSITSFICCSNNSCPFTFDFYHLCSVILSFRLVFTCFYFLQNHLCVFSSPSRLTSLCIETPVPVCSWLLTAASLSFIFTLKHFSYLHGCVHSILNIVYTVLSIKPHICHFKFFLYLWGDVLTAV